MHLAWPLRFVRASGGGDCDLCRFGWQILFRPMGYDSSVASVVGSSPGLSQCAHFPISRMQQIWLSFPHGEHELFSSGVVGWGGHDVNRPSAGLQAVPQLGSHKNPHSILEVRATISAPIQAHGA